MGGTDSCWGLFQYPAGSPAPSETGGPPQHRYQTAPSYATLTQSAVTPTLCRGPALCQALGRAPRPFSLD